MTSWGKPPRFAYGQRVKLTPLADPEGRLPEARVVDLHAFGMYGTFEYDVRWFHEGKEQKARMFEDEMEPA